MRHSFELTIKHAQDTQPWTVPYSQGVLEAQDRGLVPYILASHVVLHASKSVGKLAAVFEKLDHVDSLDHMQSQTLVMEIKAMSADLVTAALRLANLYHFDLAQVLIDRVKEKNKVTFKGF